MNKICTQCGIEKNIEDFQKRYDKPKKPHGDGYQATCRKCVSARTKEWAHKKGLYKTYREDKEKKVGEILSSGKQICKLCGTNKPLNNFNKQTYKRNKKGKLKGNKSGYSTICKECKCNSSLIKLKCGYCDEVFETIRKRKYCNPECQKRATQKKKRDRYKTHKTFRESCKQYTKDHHKKKPHLLLARKHKRKAKENQVHDGSVNGTVIEILLISRKRCPYCGIKLTSDNIRIDHIDPIKHGGTNTINNLIPCCQKCNAYKSGKPFNIWIDCLYGIYKQRAVNLYMRRHGRPPEQPAFNLIYD